MVEPGRGRGRQSPRGGYPRQAAAARTGSLFRGVRQQETQERHPRGQRRLRQRRNPHCGLCRQGRDLCLRQLPGHRRTLPETSSRAGPRQAHRDPGQDTAAGPREGDLRADLAARLPQRLRAAGRRVGVQSDSGVRLYRALRGHHDQRRLAAAIERSAIAYRWEGGVMSSPVRRSESKSEGDRSGISRREVLALSALGLVAGGPGLALAAGPQGQLSWGVHVSLAPTWFDPAETSGITNFMVLYALHDALVKPMPGESLAASLAESWSAAEDGRSYEFVLRQGAKFHNGEPVTAEDVKFSFERYRGTSHDMMKDRVASVEIPDPRHVRFNLKEPWSDFLTFYGSATGAGWIVPKKYVEKVGDEGFKKAPIGAGPYKFVSFTPGVELVFEAFDQYWRKIPSVKRLVFKVIPDETTRLAALKGGEIDLVYSIRGELAEKLQRTPGLTLKQVFPPGTQFLYFPEQWDPKSPWHDERVRRAASLAIDRKTINQALTLGHSKLAGNSFVADMFEFYWQPPAPVYDPAKAKQLLAEAGYPNGKGLLGFGRVVNRGR